MNAKLVRVGVAIGILFAGTSTSNDGHAAESPTTETPPKSGEPEVPVKEGTPEEAPSVGWVALPNIYYAPETGAGLGGFGLFFWHAGPTEKVRPSQVVASFSYTTKQQTIIDASVPLWLFENALTITPTTRSRRITRTGSRCARSMNSPNRVLASLAVKVCISVSSAKSLSEPRESCESIDSTRVS